MSISIKYVQLLIFALLVILHNSKCDYFSSVVGLEKLLKAEESLLNNLETYLENVSQKLNVVKRYVDERDNAMQHGTNTSEFDMTNPISAYKIIRRLSVDGNYIKNHIFDDTDENAYERNIKKYNNATDFIKPDKDDLKGAVRGMIRLQQTYKLSAADVANGILMERNYSRKMSASDCFALGEVLYDTDQFEKAAEWLQQAKLRFEQDYGIEATNTTDFPSLEMIEILHFFAVTVKHMDDTLLTLHLAQEMLKIDPSNEDALSIIKESRHELFLERYKAIFSNNEDDVEDNTTDEIETGIENDIKEDKPIAKVIDNSPYIKELYERTCRGENTQSAKVQRSLRCRYVVGHLSYNLIGPYKVEELNLDPYIVVYYDAIFEDEINYLIENTSAKMNTSTVGDNEGEIDHEWRSSKTAWLDSDDDEHLYDLSHRLDDITGLDTYHAEELQIVNYGIGGHYDVHYDVSDDLDDDVEHRIAHGERILTALFFISDVELGGSTVFPLLSLRVQPIKGSLLIWYNLHKSGMPDYRTLHGGCPVVKGSKWIGTQWYHDMGQEFIKPCGLTADDDISKPYKDFYNNLKTSF